ncbi:hypothetical protein CTI12_AA090040 [Artemisia annua]|uniref:Uncharacterized protein n=1 Tax=Artemisia annua TaxID=35608 RepID=A0A2U1PYB8_ARTAN|nr:hypothetical protein CTI12_AA090040 [Artemisia annua]
MGGREETRTVELRMKSPMCLWVFRATLGRRLHSYHQEFDAVRVNKFDVEDRLHELEPMLLGRKLIIQLCTKRKSRIRKNATNAKPTKSEAYIEIGIHVSIRKPGNYVAQVSPTRALVVVHFAECEIRINK